MDLGRHWAGKIYGEYYGPNGIAMPLHALDSDVEYKLPVTLIKRDAGPVPSPHEVCKFVRSAVGILLEQINLNDTKKAQSADVIIKEAHWVYHRFVRLLFVHGLVGLLPQITDHREDCNWGRSVHDSACHDLSNKPRQY